MRITDYTTRLSVAEGKILLFKSCHLSQSKIFVTYLVRGLPDVLGNFFLIINARSGGEMFGITDSVDIFI